MLDCHNGNNSSLNPEIIRCFIVRFRKTVGRLITVRIMDLYSLTSLIDNFCKMSSNDGSEDESLSL